MGQNKGKNYNQILNTAISLFKEKGFDEVSISEICQEAGVSRGTFYNIFESKENVITSFFNEATVLYENHIPSILSAENDLERLWIIHDLFLQMTIDVGWPFMKQIYKINLDQHKKVFQDTMGAESWFVPQIRRCQSLGIIKNLMEPQKLFLFMVTFSIGIGYQWCVQKGEFLYKETAFQSYEDLYDIAPEYRNLWKNIIGRTLASR